jgi:predicted O-methyltransferase YrrM
MSRYAELLTLIDQYKPESLLEIGVWNGQNAIRMINQACKHHSFAEYLGFDLFEDATAETDATEFNVKGHNQERAVMAEIRAAVGKNPSVMLIKGNTRDTLSDGMTRDFVFLDGGHSVETIASDYERVKNSKVIVLDDYYTRDNDGLGPDTTKFGCNTLVERLKEDPSLKITLLPKCDYVKGGGFTQLVVVCRQ